MAIKKNFDYPAIIIGAGKSGSIVAKGLAEAKRSVLVIDDSIIDESDLKSLGIHCLKAKASFIDAHTLSCLLPHGAIRNVSGKFIVIATGSARRLSYSGKTIVGAGPYGIEMAAKLGPGTLVIEKESRILPKEEPEFAYLIQKSLEEQGITFEFNTTVENFDDCIRATGRERNLSPLNLAELNVFYNEDGLETDRFGRTAQKNIFAVGSITQGLPLAASHQAQRIVKSLLYAPLLFSIHKEKPTPRSILAPLKLTSIGLLESEAIARYGKNRVKSFTLPLEDGGLMKVTVKRWGKKIVGASVIAETSPEIISFLALAMDQDISLPKVEGLILPEKSHIEAIKKITQLLLV